MAHIRKENRWCLDPLKEAGRGRKSVSQRYYLWPGVNLPDRTEVKRAGSAIWIYHWEVYAVLFKVERSALRVGGSARMEE